MGFQMGGVDYQCAGIGILVGQLQRHLGEYTLVAPALQSVVQLFG